MRHVFVWLLLAGCRIYDPMPLDCRISCGAGGLCPEQTTCREGVCRTRGSSGPCECRDGEQRSCGAGQGVCEPGVQRCAGAQWGSCEGAVVEQPETCNGLDDDCDGVVDEDIALPPPCERRFGLCRDASKSCLGGEWRECEAQNYGTGFETAELSCDGIDNDCDGLVDSEAVVELASETNGPWFFLTTASGFALVSTTDAGVQLQWLSSSFAPIALQLTTAQPALATSRGDTLILAQPTDAGVVFTDFEPDGGSSSRTVPSWVGLEALDVSINFAAAKVNGEVQLLSLVDGGAPETLGLATEDKLRLSQTGQTLHWSRGLTRTGDLAVLRSAAIEPLLALLNLEFGIAGVPEAQPSRPVFLENLLSTAPARTLSSFPVPALSGSQATEHRGRVLLVGIEPPDALWVVNEGGTHRRVVTSGLSSVRVTPSHEPLAALAWENGGTIWAVRRCAP